MDIAKIFSYKFKKSFFFLSTLIFFFSTVIFPAHAQTADEIAAGLESCFDYYDYGNVEVNLTTKNSLYRAGETAEIIGTIVNKNSFPLIDVVVYAQVRRMNTGPGFVNEGHYLLERKQITPPMNLLPNETRSITSSLPILNSYPNGSYQIQYFIASEKGFHYAGRPFLEEDFAGSSLFDIQNSIAPLIYFDPSSIQVNQLPFPIRGATQEFADDVLNFSVQVIDNRQAKTNLPVEVKFYDFEDTFEDFLLSEVITTVPASTGRVEVQFQPPSTGPYVMVLRMDSPTVSELKYRFAKINGPAPVLRVNDIGITNYPPGSADKAYICIHSPAPSNSLFTQVTLNILDGAKRVLNTKSISRAFSGSVLAISVPLEGSESNEEFFVQGTLNWQSPDNQTRTQNIEVRYACDVFQSSPQELTVSFDSESSTLLTGATGACNESIGNGGYLDSIRIKNKNGDIVKELYNMDSIKQDIALSSLAPGEYVAEVRGGSFSEDLPFLVAGVSSRSPIQQVLIAALLIIPILLFGTGLYYYKRRKSKEEPQV